MRIGIIGGGQLAQMMCESTPNNKYYVLERTNQCPCQSVAKIIVGEYSDSKKIALLINTTDVVTYEFENINYEVLANNKKILPNPEILKVSQNRIDEKTFAQELGINVPTFFIINNSKDLKNGLKKLNGNGILKSNTGGYDGKLQCKIKNNKITNDALEIINLGKCILEEEIKIKNETSIIATRDKFGNFVYLQPTNNIHKNGILFMTETNFKTKFEKELVKATRKIMESKKIVGTLAVEFFITNTDWYFNEMAPRPHNSGHWSIEGASVSQFTNHIKAISGEVVKKPITKKHTVMINIIGETINKVKLIKKDKDIYIHDYKKKDIKSGRKMGHITIACNTKKMLDEKVKYVLKCLGVSYE